MSKVTKLYCEYLENPINIDSKTPRLSWEIQSDKRGIKQTQYHIIISSSCDKIKNC